MAARSHPTLCAHQSPLSMGFSRQEYQSGLSCPPPVDLPNPGIEPGLPHCRQILYHLSHQGSPRMLEWVAYPFSRGIFLTQESNRGLLHCMDSLPAELPGKPKLLICTKIFYSYNLGSFCLLFLQIYFLLQFICPLFLEFKLHIYQYRW